MFVPVIDHADEKPIKEIAKDVRELDQKVRMNKKLLKRHLILLESYTLKQVGKINYTSIY
nr:hypothetical protein [Bacillus sp. B4EP4a]